MGKTRVEKLAKLRSHNSMKNEIAQLRKMVEIRNLQLEDLVRTLATKDLELLVVRRVLKSRDNVISELVQEIKKNEIPENWEFDYSQPLTHQ